MRKANQLPHIRRKMAKGRLYLYFDTGKKKPGGQPILQPLPQMRDPTFGAMYAAKVGARTRAAEPIVAAASELTVAGMVHMYQISPEFRKLAEGSRKTYNIYLTKLADQLGEAPAAEIGRREILLLIDRMAERTGAANMLLSITGALYAWGRKREHVTTRPTEGIDPFDAEDYEPWPEWLLDEALSHDDARVRLPVGLLYYTSQRLGDMVKLRWTDIRGGVLFVRQQKTKKDLEIRLHAGLLAILAQTPRRGFTILAKADGTPYSGRSIRGFLQAFAKARGMDIVPHGLRKNAVNALLEAGCSAAETAAISGQSLGMVEHYAKRRSTGRLASAAVLKWEENGR